MTTHELARRLLEGPDEAVVAAYVDDETGDLDFTGISPVIHQGQEAKEGDFWDGTATIVCLQFQGAEDKLKEHLDSAGTRPQTQ